MAYNPNHHYNRRDSSAGSFNSSQPLNSNTHSNNSVHNNGNIQQHGLSTPIEYTSRPSSASEYANPTAFYPHSAQHQQQPTYRTNVSNYYENDSNRLSLDVRAGTNPAGPYNPSLKFAPQNQNTSDSLHSLKQTLAHTLQNLQGNSVSTAYSPPENVYRSYQNRTDASADPRQVDSGHSYNARPNLSQSPYVHESPPESLYTRNMQPPTNLPSTHPGHLATNRLSHNAPVDAYAYSINNTFDTRISAAVAPVPGDVRYQASQQAHTAPQSGHGAAMYNASIANRAVSDRNSNTFAPSVVPRVTQNAQPPLAASAYYNRRPESAHVNASIQYSEGRQQNFDPRNPIVTGEQAHGYDPRLQPQAESFLNRVPSVARDNVTYDRVDGRDVTPHTIYRSSVDRNTPLYNHTSHPSSYSPYTSVNSHAIANPVATLPTRASKWSVKLVDPLDIYDQLLHNSLCIHEDAALSANVTKSASVGPRTTRDDRNIAITNMNSATKYGYSVSSPTNMSRKRAISPVNSVASDRDRDSNYYGGSGDNRYSTGDRSTRPRVSDNSDIRRYDSNDSRNSRSTSDRLDNRGTNRDRRSRSPSRSESVARGGDKSTKEHPFRPADRAVSRTTPGKGVPERKSTAHDTSIATTSIHSLSTQDKPDYASTTLSQLYTTFRTPSVAIQNTPYPTTLHVQDLYVKYPRLYVPNDFLRVTVDAQSVLEALSSGLVNKLVETVPMLVESANPVLLSNVAVNNALVPPRCTMVDATSRNNALVVPTIAGVSRVNGVLSAHRTTTFTNRFSTTDLPVKFQVRVLVSCGVEDPLSIDPHKPFEEQLRILCGQRKSGLTLLGCHWQQDLDCDDSSTDTPLTNRSLLVKTVQRALFAQALLRIPVENTVEADAGTTQYSSPGLISLCEVNYLRPSEDVDEMRYEEQMEVTTIFLYTLQPHLLQPALLTNSAQLFSGRVCGNSVGPTIHESVEKFDAKAGQDATSSSVTVEPTVGEGSSVDTAESKTIGDSVVNTGDATVETVLASLVDAVVDTVTADVSDSADLGTVSENTRLPPVIPPEPTVLLCPTPVSSEVLKDKKQSRDVVGLKMGTLAELITSYSQGDRTERVFELALAAELTMSLLATDFANTVTDFILASHTLLKRDVDERIVPVVNASRTANIPVDSVPVDESTGSIVINTTDLSDASVVVADVLNSIVNTVYGDTRAGIAVDPSGMSKDSAEGCGFAIDTTPTVEKVIVVKSENDLQEDSVQKVPGVDTSSSEGDAHELKYRFLTAARWFDMRGEKCLHLEHLKIILNASTSVLSPGAVKEAVKQVCQNDVFNYEEYF